MNAPNIIKEDNAEIPQTETRQRAWWFSKEQNFFCAQEVSDICKGFQESLDAVKQEFDSEGPFDGILGFSQGAAMVTLLCALKETQAFPYQFSFVFLIAAFQSNSKPHEALYCSTIQTPSLHVIGDTDLVIPKEMSETLLNCYLNPVVVQHPGGHYVPVSGQYKTHYLQFLQCHLKSNS
ncbi:esterase OVCA2 isoform X2 [Tachypleus tridentatus]